LSEQVIEVKMVIGNCRKKKEGDFHEERWGIEGKTKTKMKQSRCKKKGDEVHE